MADPRLANLARILVEYSTKVKKGDRVAIFTQPVAMPLVEQIYLEVLKAGGYPYVQLGGLRSRVETEALEYLLFTKGSEDQIQHVNQFGRMIREEFEVFISLYSQTNTRGLSNVSPERQRLRAVAYKDVIRIYQQRSATRDLRWVGSLYPTAAYAQDAEMSLEEFSDYVFSTTYADSDDPIGAWNRIHDEQQKLIDWLKGKKELQVKGPNIDLKLSIEGRDFINSDGERNMPSGEIFTSPLEDSAEGWVRFSYPAIRQAREVEGIELTFEKGRVVKASAMKNEGFLINMLDTDEGSRYLGEFAIGTNKRINRFIKNILFDEKIGGTIHMAVGFGFPEIGGENVSAIHWDMICDMREGGKITVDGELFYDSGEFVVLGD
jgi:aminopeptidase